MRLPAIPKPGDPLAAQWAKDVVNYLAAITPRPSPQIWPTVAAAGTTYALRGQIAPSARRASGVWSGRVVFANLRGVTVAVTGTAQPYLAIQRDLGTADYFAGPLVVPWPEGTEYYEIAALPPGDLILH